MSWKYPNYGSYCYWYMQVKDKARWPIPTNRNTTHTYIINPLSYTLVNLICSCVVMYQQQSITPKLGESSCTKGVTTDLLQHGPLYWKQYSQLICATNTSMVHETSSYVLLCMCKYCRVDVTSWQIMKQDTQVDILISKNQGLHISCHI